MAPQAILDALKNVAVSPYNEMLAFELLYSDPDSSLKKIAHKTVLANKLPTAVAKDEYGMIVPDEYRRIEAYLANKVGSFGIAVNSTTMWPSKLIDSENPTPILYYRGDLGLIESRSVSIVGSRKASDDGLRRARRMARELASGGITIVSGLARGVDTEAMASAIAAGGKVIGVIGTPIDESYPKENEHLQATVALQHLLVSQVPFYRYANQPFETKRYYFPQRNELMAAISDGTIIIEASDTSGTLSQARACLHQGRPLFILKSCLEAKDITWPKKWADKEGVYVVDSSETVIDVIENRRG